MAFNYSAPDTVTENASSGNSWKQFEWGVHPIKIKSVEVKESKAGTGYNVSCDIEGINEAKGMSARFVSLGWFRKIATKDEDKAFQLGRKQLDAINTIQKEWFQAKQDGNKPLAEKKDNERRVLEDTAFKENGKWYGLARQMEDLVKFIVVFGNADKFANIPATYDQKQWLEAAVKLTVDETDGAYCLLMTSPYQKDDKVYNQFAFTQNFQSPRAFFLNSVENVEFIREELADENGEPIFGEDGEPKLGDVALCLVNFKKEGVNAAKVKKTAKNCVVLKIETNDEQESSDLPFDYDESDLPF